MKKYFARIFLGSLIVCSFALAQVPEGIPKSAKETTPGIWRVVDKDGKAWLYRKTPFGYQRSPEDGAKADDGAGTRATPFGTVPSDSRAGDSGAGEAHERIKAEAGARVKTPFGDTTVPQTTVVTKVTEDGDSLRFERPNPFGVSRWTRKKSELTSEEKKLWEASRSTPRTDAR